jgi:2-C-methyl-D-erythritol 4-phosphate cytidylyltransferase
MITMNKPRYWVVVPAAGIGKRIGTHIPKQYVLLNGKTVLEHTLSKFIYHSRIEKIIVVINSQDSWWRHLRLESYCEKIIVAVGGTERCHSVNNGLQTLARFAEPHDWVLVHDAVRPCLRQEDIDKLIVQVAGHPVGGILGTKVRDTLKHTDLQNQILQTVSRENIWQALTPQMFRMHILSQALQNAIRNRATVTDEASAIESLGLVPVIVEGRCDNIKITHAEDLSLAEKYLS